MTDLLTGHLPPVTIDDMIHEVEREIRLRKRVYPEFVAARRLKQSTADEQVRRMEAVLDVLRERKD